ncbi:hypothetical protein [Vibrio mangrovi]|uniref:Lipoprotein n=1 Tax=Vibrio mangrovi TaxID=474394 RepID=A0A1Y6IVJ9_9VIBR|nr:hypothetical protein [Vibrio mangrovi]MDW6004750.1 hypothetical protein [Vibrio mangrovi]SMS01041.1 hypothetical protein VIM7927_02318 [Vibrio mangrovi]
MKTFVIGIVAMLLTACANNTNPTPNAKSYLMEEGYTYEDVKSDLSLQEIEKPLEVLLNRCYRSYSVTTGYATSKNITFTIIKEPVQQGQEYWINQSVENDGNFYLLHILVKETDNNDGVILSPTVIHRMGNIGVDQLHDIAVGRTPSCPTF